MTSSARLRFRQAPIFVHRLMRHPSWVVENLKVARWRHAESGRAIDLHRCTEFLGDEEQTILEALNVTRESYEAAKMAFWAPVRDESAPRSSWDARETLQSLVSVVVRLTEPRVMVETGVARGFTSAVALAAMHDVGHGHLYSVDLPAFEFEGQIAVGEAVPDYLKADWTVELGPSRLVLGDLLQRVGPLDVFLHDSDHTYPYQLAEYRLAWPYLRQGGVLLSDDVQNPALLTFAREVGARPYLLGSEDARAAVGLIVKRADRED